MKNLKNKLFIIFSLLCALALTSCMDLYDGHEVQTSFTVTFHGNGGIYPGTSEVTSYTQTFAYGEEKDLTLNQFVRAGYVFLGWAESETATTVAYVDGSKLKTITDRNFYAVWGSGEFTVTFDANGGTGTMEPQIYKVNVTKKLSKNTFTYEGKGFAGWALKKDATQADYPDENTMSFTKDTTLYAVWANIYTVTFVPNGGTEGDMPAQSFTENVEQALNSNTFTRAGFDFSGWARNPPVGDNPPHDYENGQKITLDSNMILYAVWTADSPDLYVAENGSDSNPGTEAAPFASLQSAISRINTVGDPSREWKIYVNGTVVGDTEISALNSNTLSILDYASEPAPHGLTPAAAVLKGSSKSVIALTSTTGCDITITNISITGGKGTTKTGNSTTYGGGIFINSSNTKLKLSAGVSVSANTANNGGGIYIENGELTLTSTAKVTANTCTADGAGIYVTGGKLTFSNGEISSNTGASNGGGIYIAAGEVAMSDGTIKSHSATNGAGVYIAGGKFTLSGGNIGISGTGNGNTASSGGGVYNAGTFTMVSGYISHNTASGTTQTSGGGGVYNTSLFNINGGEISSNIAKSSSGDNNANGGGVYNDGTMTMTGTACIGKKDASQKADRDNYSNNAKQGGGIYNVKSLTMETEETYGIYYNRASASGGGIYIVDGANTYIKAGTVAYNSRGGDDGKDGIGGAAVTSQSASAHVQAD